MKNPRELTALAQAHGVKTTKRVFFDSIDPMTHKPSPTFLDLPRPPQEIINELRAAGALPAAPPEEKRHHR